MKYCQENIFLLETIMGEKINEWMKATRIQMNIYWLCLF